MRQAIITSLKEGANAIIGNKSDQQIISQIRVRLLPFLSEIFPIMIEPTADKVSIPAVRYVFIVSDAPCTFSKNSGMLFEKVSKASLNRKYPNRRKTKFLFNKIDLTV